MEFWTSSEMAWFSEVMVNVDRRCAVTADGRCMIRGGALFCENGDAGLELSI